MTAPLEPFAGEEKFTAPPARLYTCLTDLDSLARTIPDLVSSTRIDERTLRCTVRPNFAFIRATMQLTFTIGETVPDSTIVLAISSQGIGAAMDVGCRLQIAEDPAGSRLTWTASVNRLSGLIAAVSPALIRGAADKVIRDGWARVRQHVEKPT
jgi:carbon monoxide dehydrogenase subunit G